MVEFLMGLAIFAVVGALGFLFAGEPLYTIALLLLAVMLGRLSSASAYAASAKVKTDHPHRWSNIALGVLSVLGALKLVQFLSYLL